MEPQPGRLRAVFDCMVFLQGAARRESPAGAWLNLAEVTGPARAKFPTLTGQVVAGFIDAIRNFATVIYDAPREFALERDPKDEPYLNLACRSGAEYLITRDKDLLDLSVGSGNVGLALTQPFPRLSIVDPVAFLFAVRDRVTANS